MISMFVGCSQDAVSICDFIFHMSARRDDDRSAELIRFICVIRGRLKNCRGRLRVDEAPIKSPSYG